MWVLIGGETFQHSLSRSSSHGPTSTQSITSAVDESPYHIRSWKEEVVRTSKALLSPSRQVSILLYMIQLSRFKNKRTGIYTRK